MSAARLVVVSDTHLSARTPEAASNWRSVVDHVAVTAPDLVVHAGDLTADGAVHPADLPDAGRELARLAVPWAVVPGNHDVGDIPGAGEILGPPVRGDAIARFRDTFGSDRFSIRVGAWRVLGLDAQALGAGGEVEADHRDWVEREVATIPRDMPVVVVAHRPVVPAPGDRDLPGRYVPLPARRWLLDQLGAVDVRLVVSGHVHQHLHHRHAGADHVWVPTTWAVLPDSLQRPVGSKPTGLVDLVLHDDGRLDVTTQQPEGMRHHVLGEDVVDPYG